MGRIKRPGITLGQLPTNDLRSLQGNDGGLRSGQPRLQSDDDIAKLGFVRAGSNVVQQVPNLVLGKRDKNRCGHDGIQKVVGLKLTP
jgi:hypothetical protein